MLPVDPRACVCIRDSFGFVWMFMTVFCLFVWLTGNQDGMESVRSFWRQRHEAFIPRRRIDKTPLKKKRVIRNTPKKYKRKLELSSPADPNRWRGERFSGHQDAPFAKLSKPGIITGRRHEGVESTPPWPCPSRMRIEVRCTVPFLSLPVLEAAVTGGPADWLP